jgi:predicted signal transduction protein with EAL and GGDEF domain
MLVIAEGVEDADTEQLLRRMDCDMIQGYHVARPMPLDELIAWLAARERDPVPRPAAPDATDATHASRACARRPAGLPEYR